MTPAKERANPLADINNNLKLEAKAPAASGTDTIDVTVAGAATAVSFIFNGNSYALDSAITMADERELLDAMYEAIKDEENEVSRSNFTAVHSGTDLVLVHVGALTLTSLTSSAGTHAATRT